MNGQMKKYKESLSRTPGPIMPSQIPVMTNSQAWDYAIGMIKVDGLEPTEDFKKYIEKEKRGEVTMEDAKLFLDKKYKMKEPVDA